MVERLGRRTGFPSLPGNVSPNVVKSHFGAPNATDFPKNSVSGAPLTLFAKGIALGKYTLLWEKGLPPFNKTLGRTYSTVQGHYTMRWGSIRCFVVEFVVHSLTSLSVQYRPNLFPQTNLPT